MTQAIFGLVGLVTLALGIIFGVIVIVTVVFLILNAPAGETGKFCPHCQKNVSAVKTPPNHLLHLIYTIFSCCIWLPFWVLIAKGYIGGHRCPECENKL
jgi:hypothetical protein